MNIIAPPPSGKSKPVKLNNSFLKDALVAAMREVVVTEDGRQMTVAQAGAERLKNIWLYAESNTDSISAGKLIYERVYGKAAVERVETQQEMPKVIFALDDAGIEKLNAIGHDAESGEDNDDIDSEPAVLVKVDNKEFLA